MSKKIRVANLNFQKAFITRLIHQSWKEVDNVDVDAMLDEAMDAIDEGCSLTSNIKDLEAHGLINTSKKEEKENKQKDEEYLIELESQFLGSLEPVYECIACEREFKGTRIFRNKLELIEHFFKEHGHVIAFPPKEPYNFEYIILKALVDKYVEIHKKYVSSKYFTMTCAGLYDILLFTLGLNKGDECAPSNQTPTHVLKRLGLLTRTKNQKPRMSRTQKGRIYHINSNDLEQAVFKTEFHDLKFIFGQIDINAVIQSVVKPPKPTIDEDEEESVQDIPTSTEDEFAV